MRRKLIVGLVLLAAAFLVGSYASRPASGQAGGSSWNPAWARFLKYLSLEALDDGTGHLVPTIQVNGANLGIVNGMGSTGTSNGTGNLVVGYNEFGNPLGDDRTGSHNIAFGQGNSFSSVGGMVGPKDNTISGPWASVSGGSRNLASGAHASVSAGHRNHAQGFWSSISGGGSLYSYLPFANVAGTAARWSNWEGCSISGGSYNLGYSYGTSISGGLGNVCYTWSFSGRYSAYDLSISGGIRSVITDGFLGIAFSNSINGGHNNNVVGGGRCTTISGGFYNTADSCSGVSISGGWGCHDLAGSYCAISGGRWRRVSFGDYDWRAGSLFQDY